MDLKQLDALKREALDDISKASVENIQHMNRIGEEFSRGNLPWTELYEVASDTWFNNGFRQGVLHIYGLIRSQLEQEKP